MVRIWVTSESTIDVVNFLNPHRSGAEELIRDGLSKAVPVEPGSELRVLPLAHLIGLKLYAGGPKSASDVSELLRVNPELSVTDLRKFLERFHLADALDRVIATAP